MRGAVPAAATSSRAAPTVSRFEILSKRSKDRSRSTYAPTVRSSCALQPSCRMYRVWEHGQRVLLEVFSDSSLAEIASSKSPSDVLAEAAATRGRRQKLVR